MTNSDENKNTENKKDISAKPANFSSKPVSTVVGRAFDAMELAIIQEEINRSQQENVNKEEVKENQELKNEEKKSNVIDKSINILKSTFSSRTKREDGEIKSALEAIKEGEKFLENQKKKPVITSEPKSNIKVVKSLKDSSLEKKEKEKIKENDIKPVIEAKIKSEKSLNLKKLKKNMITMMKK